MPRCSFSYRLLFQSIKGRRNRIRRTDLHALATADAFEACLILRHIHFHPAGFPAFSAVNTGIFIDPVLKERQFIEKGIKCAERTEELAKRTIDEDRQNKHQEQNTALPEKELPERRTNAFICNGKRNAPFENPLRADVFTEIGRRHPEGIGKKRTHQKDDKEK